MIEDRAAAAAAVVEVALEVEVIHIPRRSESFERVEVLKKRSDFLFQVVTT